MIHFFQFLDFHFSRSIIISLMKKILSLFTTLFLLLDCIIEFEEEENAQHKLGTIGIPIKTD